MNILHDIRNRRIAAIESARKKTPLEFLRERLTQRQDFRPFRQSLRADGIRIIAELKQASPSRGILVNPFDPEKTALEYQTGGAAALSVLTEPDYFLGSMERLTRIRNTVELPLLQKDFIVSDYQLYEGAVAGADAVLLIARMLTQRELIQFHDLALELGLVPVVEIYEKNELPLLDRLPENLFVGINNRNLTTFETNVQHAIELIDSVLSRQQCPIIFSGIKSRQELNFYRPRVQTFLVGEHLITAPDRIQALKELIQ
ncbi:MAG: indole-3-glycerol phosphate synthase TrpC [Thermoguttaceae bacterium]|nr:indole-3-glycerol phosphate synthase TrpC [Thermoguttaceae bacterium]